MVSIPPFSLGTAWGEFLRPASSCLLLFRFLPKTFRKQQRRLFVPLPKCRPSPWEQTPLAFKCPNYKGKGDSTNVRESRRTNGLLGKSPESKSTKKTGRTLAILSLATKTWWKDKDEQPQEKTEWHRIIVWNGLAEYAADKLKKGDHLYVVGTLVSNVYEKEIGKGKNKSKAQITAWQIKAFSIRKLDRKETVPTAPAAVKMQPEDIPF